MEGTSKNKIHHPSCCNLCKQAYETIEHLIMCFFFTEEVWREVEGMIGMKWVF